MTGPAVPYAPITGSEATHPVRRFLLWWIPAFAALLLTTGAWAMTTPIGDSPDEGNHAITAYAVAHGDVANLHPVVPKTFTQLQDVKTLLCARPNWNATADCQDWATPASQPDVAGFSQFATYNPTYYALVGWPSLFLPAHQSLYAMRLVSAALFALLAGAAFALSAVAFRSRIAGAATALALPPMVLFLGGTINPNAIEIAASMLCWVGMIALLSRPLPPSVARLTITVTTAGALMLVLTRLLSPLWFVVIVAAVAFSTNGWSRLWRLISRSRYFQVHLALIALGTVVALVWSVQHPAVFIGGVNGRQPSSFSEFLGITLNQIFFGFPGITLPQTFGVLGWLDLPLPAVPPVFTALWGAILAACVFGARTRAGRWGPLLLTVFWVLFPSALAAYEWGGVGWQGRYGLPIAIGIPILSAELVMARIGSHVRAQLGMRHAVRAAAVIVVLADAYAFLWSYKRYSAGLGAGWNPLAWTAWAPPLGPAPWVAAFVVGSVLFAGATWFLTSRRRSDDGAYVVAPVLEPIRIVGPDRASAPTHRA